MRILTAEAMREVDRRATEELGLPSLVLMENAAIGLAEAVAELFEDAESAAIFCGPGNNGGDGLALARHLAIRGYEVGVWLVGEREPSGDAAVQLRVCRGQGIAIDELEDEADLDEALAAAAGADLVVDALFGTGLARPLEGLFAALAERLAELPAPVLAVDLPSGLSGSRREPLGPHVVADATVTFAAPKVAHVFPPAAEAVGELVVTDLGIPPSLVEEADDEDGPLHLLVGAELAGRLPERPADTHKGDYGHVLVVAGSPGKAGAAVMTARAAVRAGAGLVTVAVPEPLLAAVDTASVESMTLALPASPSGQLVRAAVEAVLAAAEGKDVLALGPGLGGEDETAESIREIVRRAGLPLVLDADGLNAFAGRLRELRERAAPTVLTPHPGELGRLLGVAAGEVQADRLAAARRAAAESGATVVLKGNLTLVAAPPSGGRPGSVHVSTAGNPGMASGGTGDVLTGTIAALLGWLGTVDDAVPLAVHLHGLAGDLAAAVTGEASLTAGDVIDALPAAFRSLTEGDGG